MANAFSTKGASTNQGLSMSSIQKSTTSLNPKTRALDFIANKVGGTTQGLPTQVNQANPQNSRILNATSTSLTPSQSMQNKPVAPTSPVTPKTPPTSTGMVNSGTNTQTPQNTSVNTGMVNNTASQMQQPQTPLASVNPTPTYAGLVGNLANVANTPSAEYTRRSLAAEQAYKKAANFNRDVGQAQLDVTTNPEYSIDTGVGLGNRIAQNTGLQMRALADTATGLQAGAGQELTRQGLQQTGLTSAAGFAQPEQVSYGSQYINPLTGQPVIGGIGGSLNDAVTGVVQKLQSGQMTYNDALGALSGYGQGGVNALQQALPQGFNIAQSNALGGIQGTVGPAYEYASINLKNVEDLMKELPSIQNSNIPILNQITQGFSQKTGVGSEATRAVIGAVNTLRNSYASLLASSKGGTPTDYSGQALAEIPDNPTPNDIAALRKNFETLGQARKTIYGNPGATNTQSGSDSTTAGGYGFKLVNGKWVPN
jgi:hypothetical protein